jgi:hypothetical protein
MRRLCLKMTYSRGSLGSLVRPLLLTVNKTGPISGQNVLRSPLVHTCHLLNSSTKHSQVLIGKRHFHGTLPFKDVSKSPTTSHVWFQLMDATSGKPFKDTIANRVSLAPSADVVEFLEEAWEKFDKPGYLRDIPAGALKAYKNKASFDKRNAAVEDGKESPLEEDALINGLGFSEEEALIVTVPQGIFCQKLCVNIHNLIYAV